jgi:hypothetical protein
MYLHISLKGVKKRRGIKEKRKVQYKDKVQKVIRWMIEVDRERV